MKKIIEGEEYDTHTAQLICDWDNGEDEDDTMREEETLYKTPSGRYFLITYGVPLKAKSLQPKCELAYISEADAFRFANGILEEAAIKAEFPRMIKN